MSEKHGRVFGLGAAGAVLLSIPLAVTACTAPQTSQEETTAGTVHMCSSCHGPEGRSVSPTFPRLAGQQKEYLEVQLKAFRDHSRADPHAHTYMWGMAARLTDPTIEGLAAYYSGQTPAPGTSGDPADMAAGKKLYEEGMPNGDVPACSGCHGEHAEGMATFPRLAGQHRPYLELQLAAFASNARANETMHENAKNLTQDQIRELAAYLGSQ